LNSKIIFEAHDCKSKFIYRNTNNWNPICSVDMKPGKKVSVSMVGKNVEVLLKCSMGTCYKEEFKESRKDVKEFKVQGGYDLHELFVRVTAVDDAELSNVVIKYID